ncbi:hypothetical protein SSYRP_v1c06210 [Spiroplasma syrphidicola EA-1]|uniref:Uncharacterized protein n=1 Tax=Spiroplasma syrphidicola EA-1 TaxID=1276229 RepID=R4ULW9_9MOLU|nr:hypothetical protein [Spiroplasma syrphidicola]AGM26211.1 hypothetical protein SSYRP_v1c06210 [Spiroplasma syrphidicola EA-1]
MKAKKAKFLELNSIIKKHFDLQINFRQKIKAIFAHYRQVFNALGYETVALGEYGCKTMTKYDKLELEIAVIKHFPQEKSGLRDKMFQDIGKEIKRFSGVDPFQKNTQNEGYLEYKIDDEIILTVRIIPFVYKKNSNDELGYVFWRNGIEKKDNVISVVKAFNKANKISNNLLRSLVKMIKYVVGSEFGYYYIIYILVLRWFYEYFVKQYDKYLQKVTADVELDEETLAKYRSTAFQKNWFINNIDGEELIFYILERYWMSETYYFRELEFIEEEIFESISRYSWYTNSCFLTPYDYFIDFKIFNLKNYDDLNYIQNELKKSELSRIHYDFCRNHDLSLYVTPIKVAGPVGFINYAINFKKKATELFKKLPAEKRRDAISVNQREIMEELNLIAHKWLATYRNKSTYIKTYFDYKYPIISASNYYMRLQAMLSAVENLKNDDYIIGYDN